MPTKVNTEEKSQPAQSTLVVKPQTDKNKSNEKNLEHDHSVGREKIVNSEPPDRLLIPPVAVREIIKLHNGKCATIDGKKIIYLNYNGNHIGYSFVDDVWFNFRQGSEKIPPFKTFTYSSNESLYPVREYLLKLCK